MFSKSKMFANRLNPLQSRSVKLVFALMLLVLSNYVLATASPFSRQQVDTEAITQSLVSLNARYLRSSSAEKAQLLDELLVLAEHRRQLLTDLIEDNPGAVLRVALPDRLSSKMPTQVKALLEEQLELDGKVETLVEDYPDGSHRYRYYLKTGLEERISLHFTGKPPNLLTGQRIHLKGILINGALADGEETTDSAMVLSNADESVELLATNVNGTVNESSSSTVPTLENTFDEQRTAIILVNFENDPSEPWTVNEARNLVFGKVSDFFYENSYGQTWLVGDVFGWFTVSLTEVCNRSEIAQAAEDAAALTGADLSNYSRLVYLFPQTGCGGWAGMATVGGNPSQAWINGSFSFDTIGHELGHNLGLHHSRGINCQDGVIGSDCQILGYGDGLDIMGHRPGHFNAAQKERLGWLGYGSSPAIKVVDTSGVFSLDPYETAGSGVKALKILRTLDESTGEKTWLTIEFRQPIGFDGQIGDFFLVDENVFKGTTFHKVDDGVFFDTYLLDMTPESIVGDGFRDLDDPSLVSGQSYTDPVTGIAVTTEWVDDVEATVTVSLDDPQCMHKNPLVALSPTQTSWVSPGTSASFEVAVTNQDSSACTNSNFDLSATLSSDWTAQFTPQALTLAPGTTGTSTLVVTSAVSASDGFYEITASATNREDTGYSGSSTATYVISADANQAPTPLDDTAITDMNTTITIDVLANDMDADGDVLSVASVTQGASGSVAISANGKISYTPNSRFKGEDSFQYSASDGVDATWANVTVTVNKKSGGGGRSKGPNK